MVETISLGNNKWNASQVNEWVGSTMQIYLNDTYQIEDTSIEMIATSKYYLGARANNSTNGSGFYSSERSEVVNRETRSKNWIGKLGLMYPSDYIFVYALGVNDTCYIVLQ